MKTILFTFLLTLFSVTAFSQGVVKGKVIDNEGTLVGATAVLENTTVGTAADANGKFSFEASEGTYNLSIQFLGYADNTQEIKVIDGETTDVGTIRLVSNSVGLSGIEILADRATERETPVAMSNVSQKDIELKLGSRDIPLIMNSTPSVYSTPQGGGAGDARINVRGFNQRNVAIMINGVPVNDMENGWVYWSNWDGIADATSSIQMQRGLSAVNLATPSIGGTMNILTSPAEMKAGGSGKFEYGSGNFYKATLTAHSGLINEKFAVSVSGVRKVGEGVVNQTWTDAWAYYLGASYNINKKHRLEFYAVGAPQRHGQNLYKQNTAAYSEKYAREIGADQSTIDKFNESRNGRLYNENWNNVSESYSGSQMYNGREISRYNKGFLNERENFYHKPITNINWYSQWSDKVSQFTTVYYSGGKGGGTGTYGKMKYDYDSEPTRIVDWDATIANNLDPLSGEQGILRNSVNNQWTVGAISKVKVQHNDKFKTQYGIDWRKAEIQHYREVRDLLGLTSYDDTYTQNDFGSQLGLGLGDKIAYNNTNTVDWLGGFVQGEYTTGQVSVYGTAGYSMIKYGYTNHFLAADTLATGAPDTDKGELKSHSDWIAGYQLKGGANYNISETFNVFGNIGYVSKVPIFDNVIDDGDGTVAEDPKNEKFTSFELGAMYKSVDNKLILRGNYYYTIWKDRTFTRSVRIDENTTGIAFISGMKQNHQGIELEAEYRPIKYVGVKALASLAKWEYLSDVSAIVKNYDDGGAANDTVNVYANGLKVGDAPQTQVGAALQVYPVKGAYIEFVWRYNAKFYADFDPLNRDDVNDVAQVWETPSYSVFDLHANYAIPMKGKVGVDVFAHVFNIFNTFYIQDALDNSKYNGNYDNGTGTNFNHDVNTAEVYLGLPMTFNVGVKISL